MESTLLLIAIIVFVAYFGTREAFATKRDRAESIVRWFQGRRGGYSAYKNAIPDANIIEYEDSLRLLQNAQLSADKLEKLL